MDNLQLLIDYYSSYWLRTTIKLNYIPQNMKICAEKAK